MNLTDDGKKVLIENIRRGDSDSFNEMYSHYFTNVYSFSYKFLKSKELAQDCTQLTFMKIWERRDQLNRDLNFKSYLFTICKNCILKTVEKAAREDKLKEMVMRELNKDREESSSTDELEKVAQQALEQLPPQRQIIFKLCKIEGRSYKEVALNLGISDGTVRDHMFKAVKAIRRYLSLHRV
ncbi:MAG TPA: RNA polymerase sigma-70 factor [Chryseolinea sp.]|jgi:RNA polymerase sigma-70 factor (ECF subfamily)|nr:RNA polymerase sigma-70 factor [Chryseolinea sp.]